MQHTEDIGAHGCLTELGSGLFDGLFKTFGLFVMFLEPFFFSWRLLLGFCLVFVFRWISSKIHVTIRTRGLGRTFYCNEMISAVHYTFQLV